MRFFFEPRGDQFLMRPGDTFEIAVRYEEADPIPYEAVLADGIITVHAFGNVYHNGTEIEGTNYA